MAKKPTGRPNGRPRKPRWLDDYAELGPMPADPFEAMEYGFRALMISLSKTLQDPLMTEERRSHEIRQHLRAARDQLPKARLAELQRRLDEIERKATAPPRPDDVEATVIDAATADAGEPLRSDYRAHRARRA